MKVLFKAKYFKAINSKKQSDTQITAAQLHEKIQNSENLFLLDVRESFEFEYGNIPGSVLIPMNQVQQKLFELKADQEIVVICHHGIRSQMVANLLEHSGFSRVCNLIGGIDSWSQKVDGSVPRH